jgi:hypothetical protein
MSLRVLTCMCIFVCVHARAYVCVFVDVIVCDLVASRRRPRFNLGCCVTKKREREGERRT